MASTYTFLFRGKSHSLSFSPDEPVDVLKAELERLTAVAPSMQKLLYKGKNVLLNTPPEAPITSLNIPSGSKIQLLGTTNSELNNIQAVEVERQRIERIKRERAAKGQTYKLRSTSAVTSSSWTYRFHQIIPLPHLPKPDEAMTVLQRLADDPAIQHIMQKHEFSVGVLTELAPHEHPGLLGLNVNAGQEIKLRIRTDRYDGFRLYSEVRKVLCHELSHNVWGDHDNGFKELNSKLNREVAEFERSRDIGKHSLSNYTGEAYEPPVEAERQARAEALGGANAQAADPNESPDNRRQRILDAVMSRMAQAQKKQSGPAA
ncbi:WLM-domain-containing protein [Cylindrobasidium torrendii FP15055 ss-10]|uniref:WLM-domain-containing protein n=1 Tax=Cylindrobasidium torrendii FP15055 ss-10 TaxID=1314674 RepID=A0A0D7BCQ2_9AGAR|nr:WLM-domain-containing protein [Cylindrobasidium torrendii FP15055 ss-10]